MIRVQRDERGAALVTVLLFMVLTFILITSMLTVTGNEVVISSLQRDGIRALEYAQAGLNETTKRMAEGRRYYIGGGSWTSSLDPSTSVTVTRRVVGVNSGYMEIAVTSTVGRSTRRISSMVLLRTITFPPNITFAERVTEQGSADITDGDAYARTFIKYKDYPSAGSYTYTGYTISKAAGGGPAIPACYSHADCLSKYPGNSDVARWYPGTRRTENESSDTGKDLLAQMYKCPAGGGGTLPTETISGILATCASSCTSQTYTRYGFDKDTVSGTDYAVSTSLPCGLPYRYDQVTFTDEDNVSQTRLFKSIVFEQWFDNYWDFNEGALTYEKKAALTAHPEFGAVPPFPDFSAVEGNYDRKVSCTGTCTINSGDFGECILTSTTPPCQASTDRPIIVWLDGGSGTTWDINANLTGHGTLVVDGNLRINGTFEYWGTVIVNGTAENTVGGGNPKIHGGLVAQSTLSLSGNITVDGGSSYTSVPVGRTVVTGKAWWER
ncbi:MAG TPA: hypothetical protein VGK88_11725 [bacterium]|jgi:hypothetical protein